MFLLSPPVAHWFNIFVCPKLNCPLGLNCKAYFAELYKHRELGRDIWPITQVTLRSSAMTPWWLELHHNTIITALAIPAKQTLNILYPDTVALMKLGHYLITKSCVCTVTTCPADDSNPPTRVFFSLTLKLTQLAGSEFVNSAQYFKWALSELVSWQN